MYWSLERLARPSALSWSATPFSVKLGRSRWAGATDSKWLVVQAVKSTFPEPQWNGDTQNSKKFFGLLCHKIPTGTLSASLEELRDWAGEVPPLDEVFAIEEQRPGVLAEVVIDQRRLAALLSSAPEGRVSVWDSTIPAGVPSVILDIPGVWRAVLAGIGVVPEPDHARFKPSPVAMGTVLDAFIEA